MSKLIRTHLSMMYDELWADHLFKLLFTKACKNKWKLTSIDDGIHVIEK